MSRKREKRKSMQIISCPQDCLCDSSMQMLILDQDAHGGGEKWIFFSTFFSLVFPFRLYE